MDKLNADGNLLGRIGAAACLIGAAVLLARISGLGGASCPFVGAGGRCVFSVSETSRLAPADEPSAKP